MLQIERNGELINVDYTVENNLLLNVNELKTIVKNTLYGDYFSRTTRNSSYSDTYMPPSSTVFSSSKVKPGLFSYGCVELINENDTVIGNADLYLAYSGEDTVRGSINLNESFHIIDDNKVKVRLVVDFPTHASIGEVRKVRLTPKNPYRTEVLGEKDTKSYEVKYSTDSASSTTGVSLLYDENYNLMVANKKFISYKGKMYYFGQAESKRIICTGTKFYYIDNLIGTDTTTDTTISLTELIFNHSALTVLKGDTYTISFSQASSSHKFHNLVGVKEIEGVVRFGLINNSSSAKKIRFIDCDPNTFEIIEERSWVSVDSTFAVYDKFDVPLDEEGVYRVHNTNKLALNFKTMALVTVGEYKGCMTSITKEMPFCSNNATRGYLVDNEGNEYVCYRHSSSQYALGGYGSHYKIYKINNGTWTPLTITLDDPMVKGPEQTLKIILNIEID